VSEQEGQVPLEESPEARAPTIEQLLHLVLEALGDADPRHCDVAKIA
jgi:hypothetical protein